MRRDEFFGVRDVGDGLEFLSSQVSHTVKVMHVSVPEKWKTSN